jgi:MFS family permease
MLRKLTAAPAFVPTLVAALVMLLVSCIYFHPLLAGKLLKSSDVILIHGMQKDIFDYRATHPGEDAFWSTSMFSGMPAYTIHYEPEGNLIKQIQRAMRAVLPEPIPHFFLGMLGFFFLLRVFGVPVWLSLAGAFGFGFFSYHIIITEAGHGAKLAALMYGPAVLASIAWTFRGNLLAGAALLALSMGFELTSNHVQITYYLAIIVGLYGLYELVRMVRAGQVKRYVLSLAAMVVAVGVALLMSAITLLPLYEYNAYSIRGTSELQVEPGEREERPGGKKSTGVDRDYAFNWSNDRDELLTLIMANAKGGSSSAKIDRSSVLVKERGDQMMDYPWPLYWGTQPFTSGPTYAGALICFLFILGLILDRTGLKWVILYSTLLFMIMSLGKNSYGIPEVLIFFSIPAIYLLTYKKITQLSPPVYGLVLALGGFLLATAVGGDPAKTYKLTDLFFDYLPLYNKFRAPASILGMLGATLPWLALLGAHAFFQPTTDPATRRQALFVAAGVTGGLCLLTLLAPGLLLDGNFKNEQDGRLPAEIIPALEAERARLLRNDAFRSLAFILLGAGLLFAWMRKAIKSEQTVSIALAALILFDLFFVNTRYLWTEGYQTKDEFEANFMIREADLFVKQNFGNQYFRVFPTTRNPFNDSMTPYHLRSIGGYNAAKLKRYQQLIEAHISQFNANVINMLNTEFIYLNREAGIPALQLLHKCRDGELVYRNLANYGPAWIVQDVQVVPSPDAALAQLDSVNSFVIATVEAAHKDRLGSFSRDSVDLKNETIQLIRQSNRELVYEYNSDKPRFVTFSEIYYPKGWTATIDGKPAEIVQTNFVLRGLTVPAGKHTIRFYFEPTIVAQAAGFSRTGSLIFLLLVAGALALAYVQARRKPKSAA